MGKWFCFDHTKDYITKAFIISCNNVKIEEIEELLCIWLDDDINYDFPLFEENNYFVILV